MLKKTIALLLSHGVIGALGFALGVYLLPIITAPAGPAATELATLAAQAQFRGEFRRNLAGSDALHWGEGSVTVGPAAIALQGKLAPGPDYKLYLSPEFVETEAAHTEQRGAITKTYLGSVVFELVHSERAGG